jgi:hypothetical protein
MSPSNQYTHDCWHHCFCPVSPPTPARHAPGTGPPPFGPAATWNRDFTNKNGGLSKTNRDLSGNTAGRNPHEHKDWQKKLSRTSHCSAIFSWITPSLNTDTSMWTKSPKVQGFGWIWYSSLLQPVAFSDFCLALSESQSGTAQDWLTKLTRWLWEPPFSDSIQGFPPSSRKFPFLCTKINKHLNNATFTGSFNLEPSPSWENRLSCPR